MREAMLNKNQTPAILSRPPTLAAMSACFTYRKPITRTRFLHGRTLGNNGVF